MEELNSPHFEMFHEGMKMTTLRRTIAEADMLSFVQLSGLFEELWLDAGKAQATGLYEGRLVPGYMTLSFGEGLFVLGGWMRHAVGMLGVDEVRWTAPVACGDTIRAEVEVLEARPSKDPSRGVLVMRHQVLNQHDTVVLSYRSARLIATAAASAQQAT